MYRDRNENVDGSEHPAQRWRDEHLALVRAYQCIMRPGQYFSGITAAIIWRLPVPVDVRQPHVLEIAVVAPQTAPRGAGVKGSQMAAQFIGAVRLNGVPAVDATTVWATAGPRLSLPDRVALGDAIIHIPRHGGNFRPPERDAYATLNQLATESERPGRRGKSHLLAALPLLRTGSASAPESHLRLAVVEAGLPEPELDFDVYDAAGRYLGTTECVYPEFKVALEYEGDHHRTDAKQWDRDVEKQSAYEDAGWSYIRVTAQKLYQRRAELIAKISRTLKARGWQPPSG